MAVVKNTSQGYGYKYNNLADLDRAGVSIPKMRVKPTEFGDYVEYLDDNGEWQTGAKIVEFEMKGCNKAQSYGASLSYSRRYTTMMARAVACDDDDRIEKAKPSGKQSDFAKPYSPAYSGRKLDFIEVQEHLKALKTKEEIQNYKIELATSFPNMTFKQKDTLKNIFAGVER